MILVLILTMLIIAIPVLHLINERAVQRIALFIGASQLVLLAITGKIDDKLSDFIITKSDQLFTFSCNVLIQKIICLLNV
ncbi:MAG TPA: hypothetical protein PLL99_03335 [Chitinophagales bacterium]|jgi:hypothetical protein|nr:hypothetical protein [Chitinophagales bacterium]